MHCCYCNEEKIAADKVAEKLMNNMVVPAMSRL